jgi:hypothetical protein
MIHACASCHVPLYGHRPASGEEPVSHGLCNDCGDALYGPLWSSRAGHRRWTGARLSLALRRAGHSQRRLARELGVAHSTIQRAVTRERLTRYVQRRLMDSRRAAYYHGLTAPLGA